MSTLTEQFREVAMNEEIFVGDVVAKLSFHLYRVRIGDHFVACRSSVSIPIGSRVLFALSDKEYLIVEQVGYQNRETTEVIING